MKQQGEREEKQSAIGYVRVSHPDQMEDGISLDAQAARIVAYCTMRELAVFRGLGTAPQLRGSAQEAVIWHTGTSTARGKIGLCFCRPVFLFG